MLFIFNFQHSRITFSHHLPPAASLTGYLEGLGVGSGGWPFWVLRHLLETSKTQVPSPRCDTGFRDQVAEIPPLLTRALIFQWGSIQGWEAVFHSNLYVWRKKPFFFVRYLNLYKNVRKRYGECILNFIAWGRGSLGSYSYKSMVLSLRIHCAIPSIFICCLFVKWNLRQAWGLREGQCRQVGNLPGELLNTPFCQPGLAP